MTNFILTISWITLLLYQETACKPVHRDLDRYHQGPAYILSLHEPEDVWRKDLGTLRQFIWKNFARHDLAYASVVFISREGYENKIEVFVEPDKRGNWVANVEETTEYRRPSTKIPGITRKRRRADSLSWGSKNVQIPENPTSEDDTQFFENHKLQFRDHQRAVSLEL